MIDRVLRGGMQEVRKGFTWGEVRITPLREDEKESIGASGTGKVAWALEDPDDLMVIPFQVSLH